MPMPDIIAEIKKFITSIQSGAEVDKLLAQQRSLLEDLGSHRGSFRSLPHAYLKKESDTNKSITNLEGELAEIALEKRQGYKESKAFKDYCSTQGFDLTESNFEGWIKQRTERVVRSIRVKERDLAASKQDTSLTLIKNNPHMYHSKKSIVDRFSKILPENLVCAMAWQGQMGKILRALETAKENPTLFMSTNLYKLLIRCNGKVAYIDSNFEKLNEFADAFLKTIANQAKPKAEVASTSPQTEHVPAVPRVGRKKPPKPKAPGLQHARENIRRSSQEGNGANPPLLGAPNLKLVGQNLRSLAANISAMNPKVFASQGANAASGKKLKTLKKNR